MKNVISILVLALAVLSAQAAQFTLSWTDNATNESGTAIERAPGLNATTGFAVIANVAATPAERTSTGARSYVDATLADETPYTYRLRAYNAGGSTPYSNTVSGTTKPAAPGQAPAAPSLTAPPDYVPPPVVVISATLTMQGSAILAANVVASPEVTP